MFLRESKIPLSDSSITRASGLLQKQEVLKLQLQYQKEQMQAIHQQKNLLRGVFQHEFLRLHKLWDYDLSQSTLPLSRAAPTGLSRRNKSRVDRACDRAHRLPLRRGRSPEKKKEKPSRKGNNSERYQAVLTYHYSQQKRYSASESSQIRRPAHPPSAPGHPTPSDLLKDLETRINYNQSKIQRQFQTRIQDKRS